MEFLRERPHVYIGKKSLYGLQCFISGLRCGGQNEFKVDFFDFDRWFLKRNRKRESSFVAATTQAGGDDEKAFDVWFGWFAEYRNW